jgi:hypothetical protein
MTTPGGAGTPTRHSNLLRARRTGFSHRVGVSSVYLAPAHLALPYSEGLLTNE